MSPSRAGEPGRAPQGGSREQWVDVPEPGSRNIRRTVIILVAVAILLFGAAFGVGLYIKSTRQRTAPPTAPARSAQSAAPVLPPWVPSSLDGAA